MSEGAYSHEFEWWLANTVANPTPEAKAAAWAAWNARTTVSETPRKGWRLVPEEVTTKMIGAYHDAKRRDQGFQTTWTDILNAAPQEDSHMSARSQGQRSPQHEGDQHEVGIPAGAAPASVPSATPLFSAIGYVHVDTRGIITFHLEPNVKLPARECLIYIAEGKRV